MNRDRVSRSRPGRAWAVFALLALLALLTVPSSFAQDRSPSAGPVTSASACPSPYGISATPPNGTAPLLVRFTLSGPVGGATPVSWAFGDGAWFNGTGPDYTFAVHSYLAKANYTATVTVDPPSPAAVCATTIQVRASPIQVAIQASSSVGTAPLTVEFTATVSGGTGRYLSETWSFGNGAAGTGSSANYTFVAPGAYVVVLVVADSSGAQGVGEAEVTVTGLPAPVPSSGGGSLGLEVGLLFAGAFAVLVAAIYATRAYLRLRPNGGGFAPTPPVGAVEGRPPAAPSAKGVGGAPTAGRSTGTDPLVLRSSQRVIVHLAHQGIPPPPVGVRGLTQAGIGDALDLEQSNLARILHRLELAGLIRSELRHVPGFPRRVRIYLLSRSGESLARALVRPAAGSDSPSRAEGPGTGY